MLRTCTECSGFVPESCTICPHCSCAVATADIRRATPKASSKEPSARARLLRRVMKGTLIAGSSMVLAACYGCPPDACGDGGDLGGAGGTGATGSGGFSTGGNASGGSGVGGSSGGTDPGGGAGEGGLGGMGGFAGEGGAAP